MEERSRKTTPIEMLCWSIALPGFGQLMNKDYIKGIIFIILEFLINLQGGINIAIVYSFQGRIEQAINIVDYRWIMFYPCLYVFAMWDAYYSAKKKAKMTKKPFESIPFSFAAYITTIGVIFSNKPILSITFGPIFAPIIFIFIGFFLGGLVRKVMLKVF
ncbi:hypothetical protein [Bacillus pinisoli]|uniref:hypothetical protein n=1 Tax=Bacillus pinisoli TaxID=2901866 RepID=UPI001FF3D813|nr:hypothetical protein [Bacillus pinisoli]